MNRAQRRKLAALARSAEPPALGTAPAPVTTKYTPQPRISTQVHGARGELLWTQVESILQSAERGYTEQWADLTRRMLLDDHLLSVYGTYVGAIAGARRELLPALNTPEHLAQLAQEQATACANMLDALPNIERSMADALDADFTGFAVLEITWRAQGDRLLPTELTWIHPNRFRFSDTYVPYLYDRGMAVQRAQELHCEPVDGLGLPLLANKYIVHIPRLLPNYPTASGLLTACTRPWYAKNWCMRFWLSGTEVAGNPRVLGKLPENAPEVVRQELYDAMSSLSADGTGVVSGGTDVSILDPKQQGGGGAFDTLVKRCDAGMSKAVLGSTLNVEVGDSGGNRSLGESQASMTIAPRWARSAQLLANTIENQLLRPFLEFNRHVWGGHVLVPQLRLHITDDEPVIDDLAVNSGVVTKNELRRARGLEPWPPERGGDDVIPGLAAAPPPTAAFTKEGEGPIAPGPLAFRSQLTSSLRTVLSASKRTASKRKST